ncbi:hypothetical protein LSUB1_G006895 [Lachnellula subtilissima]|uniref:Mei5 protein n=1 Tax=Lachnellula subtilissima TaxID=602034 RepID=A0A8H8RML8_9HELO|nr:hypothetical protein LSUB1_G006895 [Lachnellula subtilissima]
MSTDPIQVIEALVTSVRTLASDESYKSLASVLDEVPKLKAQIISKDTELDRLRTNVATEKAAYESRTCENLETYCKQRDVSEKDKAQLDQKISILTADMKQRDVAIVEFRRTQDELQRQLDLAKKSLEDEKKKMVASNTAITKLQQSLKGKDTGIDKLKESLQNERSQVLKVKSQLQDLVKQKSSFQKELKSCTTRIGELEGFTVKLHTGDEAVWLDRFNKVWESAYQLVESVFRKDLAEECLKNSSAWEDFRDSSHLNHVIPLPQSNSPAAKQMRIATMLAILARSIDLHVFQPTYLLDDEDEIRSLLVHLATTDSKKESFCRAVLLSVFPEDQAKNAVKAIERVVRDVPYCIRELLSEAQYDSFKVGLKDVVQQAYYAWQLIQSANEKFEPLFKLKHFEDIEWQPLRFETSSTGDNEETTLRTPGGDDALLVIFPRLYIIEDNEPEPVTQGVVLMRSQSTAAAREIETINLPSPTTGRPGPKSRAIRSRTKSISLNGGSDFLSQRATLSAQ